MEQLGLVIFAATIGSVVSLLGGLYLVYGKYGKRLQAIAVPFAAGALLAAAFLGLLPEALENGDTELVAQTTLAGILLFFVLERTLRWFHHHHDEGSHTENKTTERRTSSLIIIGDTVHNFIDGLAIGAAFLVSPVAGIVTTVAVAAHEIPQEIGDFGLLISKGLRPKRVVIINALSALATVIGAVGVFLVGGSVPFPEELLLAIAAGFFIYIATSDIIPTIHAETRRRQVILQTFTVLVGVFVVAAAETAIHATIGHSHESHSEQYHEDGQHAH